MPTRINQLRFEHWNVLFMMIKMSERYCLKFECMDKEIFFLQITLMTMLYLWLNVTRGSMCTVRCELLICRLAADQTFLRKQRSELDINPSSYFFGFI